MALHAAIAWSAVRPTGRPGWLAAGHALRMGKYLFLVQSVAGEAWIDGAIGTTPAQSHAAPAHPAARVARFERIVPASLGMPTSAGTSGSSWPRSGGSTSRWSPTRSTSRSGPSAAAMRKAVAHA